MEINLQLYVSSNMCHKPSPQHLIFENRLTLNRPPRPPSRTSAPYDVPQSLVNARRGPPHQQPPRKSEGGRPPKPRDPKYLTLPPHYQWHHYE